jgi:hypothetical protein
VIFRNSDFGLVRVPSVLSHFRSKCPRYSLFPLA